MNDTTTPTAAEQAAEHLIEKLQQMADDAIGTATMQEAAAEGTRDYARQVKYEASAAFYRALAEQVGRQVGRLHAERADASSSSDGPVHSFFDLTHSSYQVVPRVLAQSMPHEWQARFVRCMEEMEAAFGYLGPIDYDVRTAESVYVNELTEEQQKATGVFVIKDSPEGSDGYYDRYGNKIEGQSRVMVPVPDPLPPYSRGRTRVPRADQMAQAGGESESDGKRPFTMDDYREQM